MQRKSVFALALALIVLTFVFVPVFSGTAVTLPPVSSQIDEPLAATILYPSDDAPVMEGAIYRTSPDEPYLGVGYDNTGEYTLYNTVGRIRSYLKFDLSSISADDILVSATLHLTHAGGVDYPGASRTTTFYRVTGDWDENSLNWNNQPAYANAVGTVSTTYDYSGEVSFDVTEQVRNWVTGSQPNYGLAAVGYESMPGIYRIFFSKGYVGQPELHISYIPAPPPVLDAWPGNLSARATSTFTEGAPSLNVGNVTYGTLAWTANKVGTASWLTLNQTSGSATPTNPGTVGFSINAAGLPPGTYTEQIRISSSTPNVENTPLITTFTLEVVDSLNTVYLPATIGGSSGSTSSTPKIVAVVIGIADYQHLDPAPNSGNWPDAWGYDLYAPIFDAADVVAWLQNRLNVSPDNIIQLTEQDATRTDILGALDLAAQKVCDISAVSVDAVQACAAAEDTVFLFYYSGHGGQTPDDGSDEGDGYDEFIAAYDTNLNEITGVFSPVVTDDDLEAKLAAIPAGRIVTVIDSCYSGGMMTTTALDEAPTHLRRGLNNPQAPNSTTTVEAMAELTGENRLIITAGTGDQATWESYALQNGVFTHYFLQGLVDALNDANGNGRISAEEAYWFSRDLVAAWADQNTDDQQDPDIDDQILGQVDLTAAP